MRAGIATGLRGAAIHYAIWIGVTYVIEAVFSYSPARGAYGAISAWWATLYVGYLSRIGTSALIPIAAVVVILDVIGLNAITLAMPDGSVPTLSLVFPLIVIGQAVTLMSPVFINIVVRFTLGRFS